MKNLTKMFLITGIVFLFFACEREKEQVKNKTASSVSTNLPKAQKKHVKTSYGNFNQFWKTSRQAVIENDKSKIAEVTKFPFETRGPIDEDPVVKFDSNRFDQVFRIFLDQTVSTIDSTGKISDITELETIKRKILPDSTNIFETWTRIGKLEFRKTGNSWYLTFAYLEYPTIDKLQKELN